jgi:WD40 repeat protein/pimeloyl-ACP methyl ester carboxylesterase
VGGSRGEIGVTSIPPTAPPTLSPTQTAAPAPVASAGPVYSLAFSPDGKTIAAAGYSQIRLQDAKTGQVLKMLEGHTSFVWGVAWSPDGNALASAGQDGTRLWDAKAYQELNALDAAWSFCVAWSPDGKQLATGSQSGKIYLWDAETGRLSREMTGSTVTPIISISWSPDGRTIAAGQLDGIIQLWDAGTGDPLDSLIGNKESRSDVNGLAWSPDGRILASAHQDGRVRLWDIETRQILLTQEGHKGWTRGVAWSPDGKQIAAGDGLYDRTMPAGRVVTWATSSLALTVDPMPTATPDVPFELVSLTTEDNVTLSATLFGQGKLAVILAHQGTEGTDQKSWQPFARVLAEKGYAALTLDFRGRGQSQGVLQASQLIKDVNAAIQFLRGRGYQRIVCMGASMGGTACLRAALDHDLAGLVVIASPMSSGAPTAVEPDEFSKLTLPKLYVCAENDRYSPVIPQMKQMFELSPEPKQIKFFPGTVHGTELFDTEHGDEFRNLLLTFLEPLR